MVAKLFFGFFLLSSSGAILGSCIYMGFRDEMEARRQGESLVLLGITWIASGMSLAVWGYIEKIQEPQAYFFVAVVFFLLMAGAACIIRSTDRFN